jgi:IS5 family transposase
LLSGTGILKYCHYVGSHKDTDARWAKKNEEKHFGYQNHVFADSETKLILDDEVTDAAVHDSIPCLEVVPPEPLYPGQDIYLDSAFVGSEHNPIFDDLKERGFNPQICEKGVRNHPLTPLQRFCNRVKSSVRCRIEHIFGAQKKRMGDEILRTIGMKRARFWIGMRNLASNMCRLVTLERLK